PTWLRSRRPMWLVLVLGGITLAAFFALRQWPDQRPQPALVQHPAKSGSSILAAKAPIEHESSSNDSNSKKNPALTPQPQQPDLVSRPAPMLKPTVHSNSVHPIKKSPTPAAAEAPVAEPKPQSTHNSSSDKLYFDPERL